MLLQCITRNIGAVALERRKNEKTTIHMFFRHLRLSGFLPRQSGEDANKKSESRSALYMVAK